MEDNKTPNKELAAVCGLLCSACSIYIGTMEDPERLEQLAKRHGGSVEDLVCHGCRSDKLGVQCRSCHFIACAAEKHIDFCGECSDFPCEKLAEFQSAMPHRAELWDAHKRIAEAGFETWYKEATEHYTCPECQTINSTYDLTCRKCGRKPSCAFVEAHEQEITKFFESFR